MTMPNLEQASTTPEETKETSAETPETPETPSETKETAVSEKEEYKYTEADVEKIRRETQAAKDKEVARERQRLTDEQTEKEKQRTAWQQNHLTEAEEKAAEDIEKQVLTDMGLDTPNATSNKIMNFYRQNVLRDRTGQGVYEALLKDRDSHHLTAREVTATNLAVRYGASEESQKILKEVEPLKQAILEAIEVREKKYNRTLSTDEMEDVAKAVHYDFQRKPKTPETKPPVRRPDNSVPSPSGGGKLTPERVSKMSAQERWEHRDEITKMKLT